LFDIFPKGLYFGLKKGWVKFTGFVRDGLRILEGGEIEGLRKRDEV
jgi:hypothetical protein